MNCLFGISITLVLGYLVGRLMQKFKIPSVAGYVIIGLLLGNSFLGVIGSDFIENTGVISDIALGFIAFTIGGELIISVLRKIGLRVFVIAFFEAFLAFAVVVGAMLMMKLELATALLLGAVASATAPAATLMVIKELKSEGPLTSTLLAVVAIDDAFALMIYAVASSVAKVLVFNSGTLNYSQVILVPLMEIGGSVLLGIGLGLALTFLLKSSRDDSEVLIVVIAAILAATGIANQFDLSPLLTNMAMGVLAANLSERRQKAFYVIESISSPIYVSFFVIAGSRLQVEALASIGVICLVYTLARAIGKVAGASFGATVTHAAPAVKKYVGCGLISQIGVAIGLAIIISQEFAGTAVCDMIINILLATTIFTEIVGPLLSKMALVKSGEAQTSRANMNKSNAKTANRGQRKDKKNLVYKVQ